MKNYLNIYKLVLCSKMHTFLLKILISYLPQESIFNIVGKTIGKVLNDGNFFPSFKRENLINFLNKIVCIF